MPSLGEQVRGGLLYLNIQQYLNSFWLNFTIHQKSLSFFFDFNVFWENSNFIYVKIPLEFKIWMKWKLHPTNLLNHSNPSPSKFRKTIFKSSFSLPIINFPIHWISQVTFSIFTEDYLKSVYLFHRVFRSIRGDENMKNFQKIDCSV